MKSASEKMRDMLAVCQMKPPVLPVVSNVTGEFYQNLDQIRMCLVQQILCPVQWVSTVERLIREGHRLFVEVGPGRTLSGLMREYGKDVKVMNVEKMDDLGKISGMEAAS
jgi:[acyl-carrier-protein] S-malonyltransferase